LTELGIGEALVTALNEKGIPTPLSHTMLRAPQSRMDVLMPREIRIILNQSELIEKYEVPIDRESAHEILSEKIDKARAAEQQEALRKQNEKASRSISRRRAEKSTLEKIMSNPTTRQIGRTIARELTRGLLGVLGVGGTKKRRRRK
jgi:hypothetical protein